MVQLLLSSQLSGCAGGQVVLPAQRATCRQVVAGAQAVPTGAY
jgi:hypothetical protein